MKTLKKLLPYAGCFLLFILLSYGERTLNMRPFLLGFFMALVYSRQNLLLLIPMYVVAAAAFWWDWSTIVYALVPPLFAFIALVLCYRLKKPLGLSAVNICAVLANLTLLFFADDTTELLYVAVSVVGNLFMLNLSMVMLYAVSVRGMRYRLSPQEALSLFAFSAVIALCLARTEIAGFPLLPLFAIPAVAFAAAGGGVLPMAAAGIIGIGAALGALDLSLAGMYFLSGAAACLAVRRTAFASVAAFFGFALPLLLAEMYFDWRSLVSGAVGVVLHLALYKPLTPYLVAVVTAQRKEQGGRFMINRTRLDVAQKLSHLSAVFGDMEQVLKPADGSIGPAAGKASVTDAVKRDVCLNCQKRSECESVLGGDTAYALSELVEAADRRGKATILDTPPYLSSRCRHVNRLIDNVNRLVRGAAERNENVREQRAAGELLARQMGGVAGILSELKKDVEEPVSYDTRIERRLIDELQYRDIKAIEAIVYREQNEACLTLIVALDDEHKYELLATVNKVMGARMCVNKRESTLKGNVTLHFIKEPSFGVTYGSFGLPKEGSVSGDTSDAMSLGRGRVMVILSDGMGSGEDAAKASTLAVRMLEGFYKAGFQHGAVISAASRLLTLRSGEDFNAVDLVVIDLETAQADFIKLGGREGYVLSGGTVDLVPCGSLPIGIIDEVAPCISRRTLKDGDTFVLMSDGVADILDREKVEAVLMSAVHDNPNVIAKDLVTNAVALGGRADDMSCIVGRLFKRVG